MKQKLLLLIFVVIGMCKTSSFAQEKEYMLARDSYEWYKTSKTVNGKKKYGAQNRNGNVIVPAEYNDIYYADYCYDCDGVSPIIFGFVVRKEENRGWYNKSGKCVIPCSRGYKRIRKYDSDTYGTYYSFSNSDGGGICDRNGKEVVFVKAKGLRHIECCHREVKGKKYYYLLFFEENNDYCGIADANGNIVVAPEFTYNGHQTELDHLISIRVTTTNNPLFGNQRESLAEAEGQLSGTSKQSNVYSSVEEFKNGNTKYYKVGKGGRYGLIGPNGKAIVPTEMEALESAGTGYLRYKLNGFWGLMNYAGKIIIDTDRGYTSIGDFKTFNKRFSYTMTGYKGECDATGRQISKIKMETPKQNTSVASSSGSSSSSSSSSNSNSGNNTTTIHVEHHRDPIPVQQWQACLACGGMGTMGCDNCGGSGTKYIGDRLHRCSLCNGQGIIPCRSCYGNKGQYITVYR